MQALITSLWGSNVYQVDTVSMSEAAAITSSDSVQLHTGVACELCECPVPTLLNLVPIDVQIMYRPSARAATHYYNRPQIRVAR